VGCGTGILGKFVNAAVKESSSILDYFFGVDLSEEMIAIAKTNNPRGIFLKQDFLSFDPKPIKISSIIFNESLHNFIDVEACLTHAKKLLNPSKGRIIISNPKGYKHVLMQRSKNKWLVPSFLPDNSELITIANKLQMRVVLQPAIDRPHYLAVLELI
jgi:SAM-dependent methyltransferase